MPELNLTSLPAQGPLLGIDPGAKSIGVAASDGLRMIASPVEIIARGRKLRPVLDRLFEIYDERACVGLVIGLPLNLDGSSGPRVQAAKALVFNLLQFRICFYYFSFLFFQNKYFQGNSNNKQY